MYIPQFPGNVNSLPAAEGNREIQEFRIQAQAKQALTDKNRLFDLKRQVLSVSVRIDVVAY
jgi:hypothetical protein